MEIPLEDPEMGKTTLAWNLLGWELERRVRINWGFWSLKEEESWGQNIPSIRRKQNRAY